MKKTLVLPTTPTTGVLLDLPAESFEDALVVVCVLLSPVMDSPDVVAGELARFETSAGPGASDFIDTRTGDSAGARETQATAAAWSSSPSSKSRERAGY